MFSSILSLGGDIFRYRPRMTMLALMLVVVGGLLEGVGLVLFLPLLRALTDLSGGDTGTMAIGVFGSEIVVSQAQLLVGTCIAFLVVVALRTGALRLRDRILGELEFSFVDHLRVSILETLAATPWHKLRLLDQARVENAMITETERVRASATLLGRSVVDGVLITIQVGLILIVAPGLGALSLAMIGCILIVVYPTLRQGFGLGDALSASGRDMHQVTAQFLQNLKTAKGQSTEHRYAEFYRMTLKRRRGHLIAFLRKRVAARSFLQLAGAVAAVVVLLSGIFILETEPEIALLVLIILSRLIGPVSSLSESYQVLIHSFPAYQSINDLRVRLSDMTDVAPPVADMPSVAGSGAPILDLDRISYAQPGGKCVLSDVTLSIRRGEHVAVVGGSGAGKTTLLDVALGLLPARDGGVRYFGTPASDARAAAFRAVCGYVPQESFLINGTLAENLRWIKPDTSDADLRSALDQIGAPHLALDLPVGDRGTRLSGGERQRIAIAQILLRDPPLLILDEALNAVSQEDAETIMQSLRRARPDMALIVITHRMADLAGVDKFYRLSDGMLYDEGRPRPDSVQG